MSDNKIDVAGDGGVVEQTISPAKEETKELRLIPNNDPRLLNMIAPFQDSMLKEHGFKDRKELAVQMQLAMSRYGGIGLSANQVGLPFRMFVMGGHPQIANGALINVFNPVIKEYSKNTVLLKEGCLSFPFIFLAIPRPERIKVGFENEDGKEQEVELDGMLSRIFQHEYDHMQGLVFTEKVSKLKFDLAQKKAQKQFKRWQKMSEQNQT